MRMMADVVGSLAGLFSHGGWEAPKQGGGTLLGMQLIH